MIEGQHFNYGNKKGFQYIREASDLHNIEDNKYDFLLSSHCLEHCANAIKTLKEWQRVVKKGGYLLIIVPDRSHTFDRNRPLTELGHFIEDYTNNKGEDDLTHLEEILALHDMSRDRLAGTTEQFRQRSLNNLDNRCLHHHTFSLPSIVKLMEYTGLTVVRKDYAHPHHNIVLAQKS